MRWVGRVVLVLAIVIAAGWLWLRSSLPEPNATLRVDGLAAPVTIVRDTYGIPTVTAANERDAAFAMGWLHAQNRLFQMDLARRFGAGRGLRRDAGQRADSHEPDDHRNNADRDHSWHY